MEEPGLLESLFAYKAWANEALLAELGEKAVGIPAHDLHAALRTLNHAYVVDRIFAAHLAGTTHGFGATNTEQTPDLTALDEAVRSSDAWYADYVRALAPGQLSEAISFAFTDGKPGRMTRGEILLHVALHNGYHRGQVGRSLPQLTSAPFRDTFTTYLHATQPGRRRPD